MGKAAPIIAAAAFTLPQAQALTESQARYALADSINKLIAATGFVVSPYDIVIFAFRPAVAGTAANVNGTAGSFEFRVTPSGVTPSEYSDGTITPMPFDPTSNETISAPTLKAWTANGTLYVSGLVQGETWQVYDLSGRLVYSGAVAAEKSEIRLSQRGAYIIRAVNGTLKITL
jgi:hypothetical protein